MDHCIEPQRARRRHGVHEEKNKIIFVTFVSPLCLCGYVLIRVGYCTGIIRCTIFTNYGIIGVFYWSEDCTDCVKFLKSRLSKRAR